MRDFQLPGRSQVFSKSGMVATSHPVASLVGVSVLKNGGNAADAALAMALVLPICEPQSTGLFGDAFALIKPQGTDDIFGINGSGPTPKGFSEEEIRGKGHKNMPKNDACSVTMPGAISAFELIAKNYSKLGLSEACQPAIKYAFDGIPVHPRVALDWSLDGKNLSGIARDLYLINGGVPKVGQVFAAPGQGEILKKISKEGSKGFYSGEVAEDFVSKSFWFGDLLTKEQVMEGWDYFLHSTEFEKLKPIVDPEKFNNVFGAYPVHFITNIPCTRLLKH